MTGLATPCPRCLKLAREHKLRVEMVQSIPTRIGAAPLSIHDGRKCCYDCASADTLIKLKYFANDDMGFYMARVAVGNERSDQYRLPGVPLGLVQQGLVRPSNPDDFETHRAWLKAHRRFDIDPDDEP